MMDRYEFPEKKDEASVRHSLRRFAVVVGIILVCVGVARIMGWIP
jgi:hypothetical protein